MQEKQEYEGLTKTITFILHDDHVVFDQESANGNELKVFVDTGSPGRVQSIDKGSNLFTGSISSNQESFCWWLKKLAVAIEREGEDQNLIPQHPLGKHFLGNSVERISTLVGTPIDILLGIDILRNYYFSFSYKNKTLFVSRELPQPNGDGDYKEGKVVSLIPSALQVPQVKFYLAAEEFCGLLFCLPVLKK